MKTMKNGPYNLVVAPDGFPGKRYRGRYAYEHTIVWWQFSGFIPPVGHEIHHVNGEHRDNRIENLRLVTAADHRKLHGLMQSEAALRIIKCGWCSKEIKLKKSVIKTRLRFRKFGKLFCSSFCGAKHYVAHNRAT